MNFHEERLKEKAIDFKNFFSNNIYPKWLEDGYDYKGLQP